MRPEVIVRLPALPEIVPASSTVIARESDGPLGQLTVPTHSLAAKAGPAAATKLAPKTSIPAKNGRLKMVATLAVITAPVGSRTLYRNRMKKKIESRTFLYSKLVSTLHVSFEYIIQISRASLFIFAK